MLEGVLVVVRESLRVRPIDLPVEAERFMRKSYRHGDRCLWIFELFSHSLELGREVVEEHGPEGVWDAHTGAKRSESGCHKF
jgi:hypothetical protein